MILHCPKYYPSIHVSRAALPTAIILPSASTLSGISQGNTQWELSTSSTRSGQYERATQSAVEESPNLLNLTLAKHSRPGLVRSTLRRSGFGISCHGDAVTRASYATKRKILKPAASSSSTTTKTPSPKTTVAKSIPKPMAFNDAVGHNARMRVIMQAPTATNDDILSMIDKGTVMEAAAAVPTTPKSTVNKAHARHLSPAANSRRPSHSVQSATSEKTPARAGLTAITGSAALVNSDKNIDLLATTPAVTNQSLQQLPLVNLEHTTKSPSGRTNGPPAPSATANTGKPIAKPAKQVELSDMATAATAVKVPPQTPRPDAILLGQSSKQHLHRLPAHEVAEQKLVHRRVVGWEDGELAKEASHVLSPRVEAQRLRHLELSIKDAVRQQREDEENEAKRRAAARETYVQWQDLTNGPVIQGNLIQDSFRDLIALYKRFPSRLQERKRRMSVGNAEVGAVMNDIREPSICRQSKLLETTQASVQDHLDSVITALGRRTAYWADQQGTHVRWLDDYSHMAHISRKFTGLTRYYDTSRAELHSRRVSQLAVSEPFSACWEQRNDVKRQYKILKSSISPERLAQLEPKLLQSQKTLRVLQDMVVRPNGLLERLDVWRAMTGSPVDQELHRALTPFWQHVSRTSQFPADLQKARKSLVEGRPNKAKWPERFKVMFAKLEALNQIPYEFQGEFDKLEVAVWNAIKDQEKRGLLDGHSLRRWHAAKLAEMLKADTKRVLRQRRKEEGTLIKKGTTKPKIGSIPRPSEGLRIHKYRTNRTHVVNKKVPALGTTPSDARENTSRRAKFVRGLEGAKSTPTTDPNQPSDRRESQDVKKPVSASGVASALPVLTNEPLRASNASTFATPVEAPRSSKRPARRRRQRAAKARANLKSPQTDREAAYATADTIWRKPASGRPESHQSSATGAVSSGARLKNPDSRAEESSLEPLDGVGEVVDGFGEDEGFPVGNEEEEPRRIWRKTNSDCAKSDQSSQKDTAASGASGKKPQSNPGLIDDMGKVVDAFGEDKGFPVDDEGEGPLNISPSFKIRRTTSRASTKSDPSSSIGVASPEPRPKKSNSSPELVDKVGEPGNRVKEGKGIPLGSGGFGLLNIHHSNKLQLPLVGTTRDEDRFALPTCASEQDTPLRSKSTEAIECQGKKMSYHNSDFRNFHQARILERAEGGITGITKAAWLGSWASTLLPGAIRSQASKQPPSSNPPSNSGGPPSGDGGSDQPGSRASSGGYESSSVASSSDESSSERPSESGAGINEPKEVHLRLLYQIPEATLKAAMLSSRSGTSAYWSHDMYRGPKGEKVKVHYCRSTRDAADQVAKLFLNQDVLGFDIEWKPDSRDEHGIKKNVSLVQLACDERIALFHIAMYKGDSIEQVLPPTLKTIMESPNITKAGVSIRADCTRLRKFLDIQAQGIFELSHLYKLVKFSTTNRRLVNKRLVSLAQQVEEHLQLPLNKGQVRESDWSKELSYEQVRYAASDSYAAVHLFDVMERKRKELDPTPPRPAHAELNLPIAMAAEVVVALTDESPDVQEEQDDQAADVGDDQVLGDSRTEGPESPGSGEGIAVEEPLEDVNNEDEVIGDNGQELKVEIVTTTLDDLSLSEDPRVATSTGSDGSDTTSAFDAAESWTSHYLAKRDPARKILRPRASAANLRAYYLWQHRNLALDQIAAYLREPPMQLSTVALYTLDAVRLENLVYDKDRAKSELFGHVSHAILKTRYRRILEEVQEH